MKQGGFFCFPGEEGQDEGWRASSVFHSLKTSQFYLLVQLSVGGTNMKEE